MKAAKSKSKVSAQQKFFLLPHELNNHSHGVDSKKHNNIIAK